MNPLTLAARMLRPQIFIRLMAPFMLALAVHGRLFDVPRAGVIALASLALLWIASTSWNDLGDKGADGINVAGDPGRPLVRGETTRQTLGLLSVTTAAAGVALAVVAGAGCAALLTTGLLLSALYSMPALRLGSRTYTAYPILGLCFGALPYLMATMSMEMPSARDLAFAAVLTVMFTGRLLLKDYRDVAGDRIIGKQTYLLRHDSRTTAATCGVLVATSSVALAALLQTTPAILVLTAGYILLLLADLVGLATSAQWSRQGVHIVLLVRTSALYLLSISLAAAQMPAAPLGAVLAVVGGLAVTMHLLNSSVGDRLSDLAIIRSPQRALLPVPV